MKLQSLLTFAVLALTGCAQTPDLVAIPYVSPPKNDNFSTVVLFRAHAVPTKLDARFFIDGSRVAVLPDMMHTWVQIPPGSHTVTVQFPMLAVMREVKLAETFEAGKTYFLRYEGTAPRGGTPLIGPSGSYVGSVGGSGSYSNTLKAVSQETADAVIRELRLSYISAVAKGE